jgi:hypothetical protein
VSIAVLDEFGQKHGPRYTSRLQLQSYRPQSEVLLPPNLTDHVAEDLTSRAAVAFVGQSGAQLSLDVDRLPACPSSVNLVDDNERLEINLLSLVNGTRTLNRRSTVEIDC